MTLKETLLGKLGLFVISPDKGFVLGINASDYAVLGQVREDGSHIPVAFPWFSYPSGKEKADIRHNLRFAQVVAACRFATHCCVHPPRKPAELEKRVR